MPPSLLSVSCDRSSFLFSWCCTTVFLNLFIFCYCPCQLKDYMCSYNLYIKTGRFVLLSLTPKNQLSPLCRYYCPYWEDVLYREVTWLPRNSKWASVGQVFESISHTFLRHASFYMVEFKEHSVLSAFPFAIYPLSTWHMDVTLF